MSLSKLLKRAARLAKENPEVAAAVVSVAAPVMIKKAPKLAPIAATVVRVVKAAR